MAKQRQNSGSLAKTIDRLEWMREQMLTLQRALQRVELDKRGRLSSFNLEFLAAFRAFHPLKIHSLDQIRSDRESALWAFLIQRRLHAFQIDFS
jgi:hypothetical protein